MTEVKYHNILVPIDGSRATSSVLAAGIRSALTNGAHLDLLQIVQTAEITDNYSQAQASADATYLQVKLVSERLNDLKKKATDQGVKSCNIHIRFGNPKRVIAKEFPHDHGNDLIVIGSTGMNRIERTMLGSVTSYVIRHSLADVMVIHPDSK